MAHMQTSQDHLMSDDAGSDAYGSDEDAYSENSADDCYVEDVGWKDDSEQLTRLYQNKRKWEEVECARVMARRDHGGAQFRAHLPPHYSSSPPQRTRLVAGVAAANPDGIPVLVKHGVYL